jgi:hypothetical protein
MATAQKFRVKVYFLRNHVSPLLAFRAEALCTQLARDHEEISEIVTLFEGDWFELLLLTRDGKLHTFKPVEAKDHEVETFFSYLPMLVAPLVQHRPTARLKTEKEYNAQRTVATTKKGNAI